MKRVLVVVACAAILLAAAGFFLELGPFSPAVEELVEEKVGHDASCRKLGLEEIAGERETISRCVYMVNSTQTLARCYVIEGGEAVDVTARVNC